MAKAEQSPPFKMKVENGHLVPAAAWDAERLASYRNGSEVNCIITQEVASWRRRKYWAILGNVVKTCPVRQKRSEDLHKAIRLKLGIVESFTTIGGATKVELRSTSLMDEQEFEAFYHEAMELLRDVTGVDVETLGKESADVGRDETEQPEESSPDAPASGSGSSGDPSSDPHSAAADQSAGAADQEDGSDIGATAEEPSSDPALSEADQKKWLVTLAAVIAAVMKTGSERDVVDASKGHQRDGLSEGVTKKARSIVNYGRQVARKEIEFADGLDVIAGVAGCEAREIKP